MAEASATSELGPLREASPRVSRGLVVLFFALLPFIFDALATIMEARDWMESEIQQQDGQDHFDFIIVGAGSAGSVVANRLSADPSNRVLILEEGGDPNPFSRIPALDEPLISLKHPSMFFRYKTTKQSQACMRNKGICPIPTGKGLGGTSEINGMAHLRGSPDDVNEWAKITQDPIWDYSNVLQAFTKSEDYHGFNKNPGKFHGKGGELYISKHETTDFMKYFYAAAKEKDLELRDFNSQFLHGYGPMDLARKGERWGSYQAFLKPILGRNNLVIYRYAQATKVHLTGSGKAFGITYFRHGRQGFVRAKKEIILSAGAIGSPKLLLLSGIGPRKSLAAVGILAKVDLPVGKNFQDRTEGVPIEFRINRTLSFQPEKDLRVRDIEDYIYHGKGPIATPNFHARGLVYTSSGVQGAGGDPIRPDVELIWSPLRDRFKVIPLNLRPKSVGEIRLRSKDPRDSPLIDPNYFSHPSDMKSLLAGVAYAVNYVRSSKTFQSLNATLAPNRAVPGCEDKVYVSPAYWTCSIRADTPISYHMFGSCRMGHGNDAEAVVDSRLRVRHTKGLRVIDNSVIPGVMTGHTNAAATMIGEMGSSFILNP